MLRRGIRTVEQLLGDLSGFIKAKLETQERVSVLEVGCGYGLAMIDLLAAFRPRIELTGINLSEEDGNESLLREMAPARCGVTDEELNSWRFPRIIFADASKPLPFESESFDLIYSAVALWLFSDKIAFLEECNRLLKEGGMARTTPAVGVVRKEQVEAMPKNYSSLWEIWDKGEIREPLKFLSSVRGVSVHQTKEGRYIQIDKQPTLDCGLRLIAAIDYKQFRRDWQGVKSIYTTYRKEK